MSTKTIDVEPPLSASEPRSASEPPLSASETLIDTEAPSSAADASIDTEAPSAAGTPTSIAAAGTSITAAKSSIIEEASTIFGVRFEAILDALDNGFSREKYDAADDTCEEKISEPQFDALSFVLEHSNNTGCFLSIIKNHTTIDTIGELKRALTWIKQFKQFEHIGDSDQYERRYWFTLDWRPPVSAAIVKPSFTLVEGSLESMLQACHAIIVKGSNRWQKQLDTQLTAIKKRFSIYYKELNEKIVSPLEASNDRIRFAALKKSVLQAVRSYLLECISNVENGIAHKYSVEEQRLSPVESSTSRVKSLISAIDKLTSFIRAISRIFKDIPATLKNFYWSRAMRQSDTEASDDLSCLLRFAGVALESDFHETPKHCYEPEIDYYDRRTLGNSMGSPTNSNKNSEPELNPETLSSVVNSQPKYAQLRVDMMHPDFQYAGRNPVKLDEFKADTAPADLFVLPIEGENDVDDFDYNEPINGVLHFGRYDNQLLSGLMTITKMQKLVYAAESSLTPDNEATHESANAEYNIHFKPILDEMVSKLTGILSIFDGFISQCDEALAVPVITKEQLAQVNTVLKKNKAPAKKADSKEI